MKKPILIASACLILLIIGSIINTFYISRLMFEASDRVREAEAAWREGNYDLTEETAEGLIEFWHDNQTYLEIVMSHTDLERAGSALSDFLSSAKNRDNFTLLRTAAQLLFAFEHLEESQRPRLGNIL